ncbi:MAG: Arginine-tRNA ligase, partial [Candidatus Nomurabacteria bacterium GW2011_GWB1_37_5]
MKLQLQQILKEIIDDLGVQDVTPNVERAGDLAHGDYTTNVAMMLVKQLKRRPLEIAEEIINKFEVRSSMFEAKERDLFTDQSGQKISGSANHNNVLQDIEKIETAPPGFINFHLSASTLGRTLEQVLEAKEAYGTAQIVQSSKLEVGSIESNPQQTASAKGGSAFGRNYELKTKKIMVEYTDPNPFKEFHVGHLYSNSVGESLVRLFESQGAEVKRADYFGDVGMHVAKSIWGMKKKLKDENLTLSDLEKKDLRERVKWLGQAYALGATAYEDPSIDGETAKEEMKDINYLVFISAQEYMKKKFGWEPQVDYRQYLKPEAVVQLEEVRVLFEKGREWSLDYFENIYKRLGTKFDYYYPESIVAEYGAKIVKENVGKVFESSDGAIIFRGEKFGLHTRVFVNSLGLPTYEAK